jgi:uncharacterized phage infection (PIP) family protein YhgE
MSDVMRLKQQLHQLSSDSRQAAGGMAGFKSKLAQQGAMVQSLIAGTATGTDKEIAQIVAAATKAVDQAVDALHVVSARCKTYADGV